MQENQDTKTDAQFQRKGELTRLVSVFFRRTAARGFSSTKLRKNKQTPETFLNKTTPGTQQELQTKRIPGKHQRYAAQNVVN